MAIFIDRDKCTACGVCVDICPEDVLAIDEVANSATVRYPNECWVCGSCTFDCAFGAIEVDLDPESALRYV
jgi:NAD-dependent dihydropyrimidine dehydrogenase PreA subunit